MQCFCWQFPPIWTWSSRTCSIFILTWCSEFSPSQKINSTANSMGSSTYWSFRRSTAFWTTLLTTRHGALRPNPNLGWKSTDYTKVPVKNLLLCSPRTNAVHPTNFDHAESNRCKQNAVFFIIINCTAAQPHGSLEIPANSILLLEFSL